MEAVKVSEVVGLIVDEPIVVNNVKQFGRDLGVSDSVLIPVVNKINTCPNTFREGLTDIFVAFVSCSEKGATVLEVGECLVKIGCKPGQENLYDRYPNPGNAIIINDNTQGYPYNSKSSGKRTYPRGKLLAMIINIKDKRPGEGYDDTHLRKTLECCGFEVRLCNKYKLKDIVKSLKTMIEEILMKEEMDEYVGGVLVSIMGRGSAFDKIQTQDEYLSINESISYFKRVKAPKMFLINMCRVTDTYFDVIPPSSTWKTWSAQYSNDLAISTKGEKRWKDVLIGFGTYFGNSGRGTDFIRMFCEEVESQANVESGKCIEFLLTEVFKRFGVTRDDSSNETEQSSELHLTKFDKHFILMYTKRENTFRNNWQDFGRKLPWIGIFF